MLGKVVNPPRNTMLEFPYSVRVQEIKHKGNPDVEEIISEAVLFNHGSLSNLFSRVYMTASHWKNISKREVVQNEIRIIIPLV